MQSRTQAANTRPVGQSGPAPVSTRWQRQALAQLLRSGYIYAVLNYIQPLEGNREADVAPSDNEFESDSSGLEGEVRVQEGSSRAAGSRPPALDCGPCLGRPPTPPGAVTRTLSASHRTCYLVTRL